MYDICALVTVYYPDKTIVKNIEMIEKQVTSVIIADNTPHTDNSLLFMDNKKIVYYANKMNMGLSGAFNKCLENDNAKRSDFIIFFDQDSLISEGLISKLIVDYNKLNNEKKNIGCIGPVYYERNADKLMIPRMRKEIFPSIYEVDCIITSSMLTTYNALSEIDFWNEEFFLDLADWDLCWRFQAIGLKCYLTKNVILNHTLGKSVKKIGFFSVKEGAPVREYYQTRDCLKLLLKNYTPLRYKIRFIFMVTVRPVIHILILSEKYLRMKYIFLGIIDFFRSVNGPFDLRNNI